MGAGSPQVVLYPAGADVQITCQGWYCVFFSGVGQQSNERCWCVTCSKRDERSRGTADCPVRRDERWSALSKEENNIPGLLQSYWREGADAARNTEALRRLKKTDCTESVTSQAGGCWDEGPLAKRNNCAAALGTAQRQLDNSGMALYTRVTQSSRCPSVWLDWVSAPVVLRDG
jgi:hypothetical protein